MLGAVSASAEQLPGSEWEPVALNGEAFEPQSEIFIRFEQDNKVFGNGGCNTFRGQFLTNGDAILFGPAATTMMACEEEISTQEFAFLSSLESARSFLRDGTKLEFADKDGKPLLSFIQRDAD